MYVAIVFLAIWFLAIFTHRDPPQFSFLMQAPRFLWILCGMRLSRQRVDAAGMIVQVGLLILVALEFGQYLGLLVLSYGEGLLVEAAVMFPTVAGMLWAVGQREAQQARRRRRHLPKK